ncbi:hypothetical protein BC832DRAFT_15962 [Gaertneriomyces semiglobifer]|nr:hypothetical protein BC832DRAFT_15962 [Gaertneriomyces semiglobifer]
MYRMKSSRRQTGCGNTPGWARDVAWSPSWCARTHHSHCESSQTRPSPRRPQTQATQCHPPTPCTCRPCPSFYLLGLPFIVIVVFGSGEGSVGQKLGFLLLPIVLPQRTPVVRNLALVLLLAEAPDRS